MLTYTPLNLISSSFYQDAPGKNNFLGVTMCLDVDVILLASHAPGSSSMRKGPYKNGSASEIEKCDWDETTGVYGAKYVTTP